MSTCLEFKPLEDKFQRKVGNLRISVTDRCNLRCQYCMPEEGIPWKKPDEILSFEEITRVAKVLHKTGVHKFRFTGGEPTIRTDFPVLVQMIHEICPEIELSITTNAIGLKQQAKVLYEAGIRKINVSLDTLHPDKFQKITLRDRFDDVMSGILEAKKYPFNTIKINAVAIKGFNDDEILDFVDFSEKTGLTIRFIELMPFTGNNWSLGEYISKSELMKVLLNHEDVEEIPIKDPSQTSREYSLRQGKATIGFVASVSESFCEFCNRIRLTSEGTIRTCLHSSHEIPLRGHLGKTDVEIYEILQRGVKEKWVGHPDFRKMHYKPPVDDRAMILIGG